MKADPNSNPLEGGWYTEFSELWERRIEKKVNVRVGTSDEEL
jgi:hypothetical protein